MSRREEPLNDGSNSISGRSTVLLSLLLLECLATRTATGTTVIPDSVIVSRPHESLKDVEREWNFPDIHFLVVKQRSQPTPYERSAFRS